MGPLSHSVLYLHGVLPQHSPSSDFGENQLSRGLISLSLLLSSHLRIFQHSRVRSSIWCYPNFNLLKSRSPPLRVYCQQLLVALFTLGFPSPPFLIELKLTPLTITRRLIMQKASRHPANAKAAEDWIDGCVDQWIKATFAHPLIHPSTYPIILRFRIGGAPTHCMHGVAGTISLP